MGPERERVMQGVIKKTKIDSLITAKLVPDCGLYLMDTPIKYINLSIHLSLAS
jgi:hypothetical protein